MNNRDKETNLRIMLLFAFSLWILIYGCRMASNLPKPVEPRYEWHKQEGALK